MVAEVQNDFYIHKDGTQYGPYQRSLFESLIFKGRVGADDLYWRPGLAEWQPVSAHQFLKDCKDPREWGLLPTLRIILSEPYRLVITLFFLLSRPTDFATSHIDTGPQSLRESVKFFLVAVSVAFILASAFSHLLLVNRMGDGLEYRLIANLLLQFAAAIPLMYLLSVCCRQRASFKGILEAAFYADGAFHILRVPISFLAPVYNSAVAGLAQEVDLIATHVEKCYAKQSFIYWLHNGQSEYLFASVNDDTITLPVWFLHYGDIIVVLPFCYLFGHLLMKRYDDRRIFHTILAAMGFAVALVGQVAVMNFVQSYAQAHTDCFNLVKSELKSTYSDLALTEQVARKVAIEMNELAKQDNFSGWAEASRGFVVLRLRVRKRADFYAIYLQLRKSYCAYEGTLWAARYLDIPVAMSPEILGPELKPKQRIISPRDCQLFIAAF